MIHSPAEATMELKYENIFDAATDDKAEAVMLKMRADLASDLRDIVAASSWAGGNNINVDVKNERIVITLGQKPKYTLNELLSQCDPNAPPVSELEVWEKSDPINELEGK
jgi:antitoxin component of MazEF toxin-antitoxin module